MTDYDMDTPASLGEFLRRLFKSDFMPHGHCYFWRHDLMALHIISDLLIVLAYYSIPVALIWLVRRKKELPFNWLFVMFGAFIFLCGTTHLMNVLTLFNGAYRIEGLLKLITGVVSCFTAVMTVRLFPKALLLKSPDEVIGLNKVLEEKSERLHEAKEEADRANRAKSEFLSRISHELRTPLNAILGFGQLLERQNPTDTQRMRLHHITAAGHHLLKLINEVLDISRIEAGNLQLSLEPVCIADVLPETLDLIRPLATERAIRLSMASDLDSSAFVLADCQRFKQVLLNLLSNAVKYNSDKGKVTISWNSSGKDTLRIVISDTGVGIPGEKLARLFTPFDRLGAEQSKVEGTGLGLALSQRLMQAMGGTIGAESTLGQGSTFWVELPRVQSPLACTSPQKSKAPEREHVSSAGKRTILYIEDNLSNLTLVQEILQDQPEIELISAMQGQLGLDLARKHLPDLILLDAHLPDLPGRELLAQLHRDTGTCHIPVIVISADATARQINELMAAGAHAYLTKPLDVTEVLHLVEEATINNPAKEGATA